MKKVIILLIPIIIALLIWTFYLYFESKRMADNSSYIKYVAIGDSYTIGNGVLEKERWPNLLVEDLKQKGIKIELLENPAVSGFSVRDAIDFELPIVERIKPDFVTVLIGANDNFRGVDTEVFEKEFKELLDGVSKNMGFSKNILILTIPDFTKSPEGKRLNAGESEMQLIMQYNEIIKIEADRRGIEVADIFPLSQNLTGEEFFIFDGLHPSALGYKTWEEVILPKALEVLSDD